MFAIEYPAQPVLGFGRVPDEPGLFPTILQVLQRAVSAQFTGEAEKIDATVGPGNATAPVTFTWAPTPWRLLFAPRSRT